MGSDRWQAAPPARGLNRRDLVDAEVDRRTHLDRSIAQVRVMTNVICIRGHGCAPVTGNSEACEARNYDLADADGRAGPAAAAPRSVDDVLSDVTAAAMELIPGADIAGVLLIGKGGKFETIAGTSDLPNQLDELQMNQRGAMHGGSRSTR